MKIFWVFFTAVFACLCLCAFPLYIYADGTYYVGEDRNGVYLQTDEYGTIYLDTDDIKDYFKSGERGTYHVETDKSGSYIVTDKQIEFYIGEASEEQLERKITEFNREQEKLAGNMETKVIIQGNQVLVPVILGYQGNETETLLLLDTGASIIALHKEIADQLNIKQSQKAEFMVAGGKTITTNVTKLSYVRVGPFEKENIYAGIIEHQGPSVTYQGLLGMNFLHELKYEIDFRKQIIVWKQ